MIKAVIFDMDGILIDSENLWQRNERELFRELGAELTDEMLEQTRGLTTGEMVDHWTSRLSLGKVSPQELAKRYDERMIGLMKSEVPLMDGAREAVRFFREKGFPLAMATCSTYDHIDAALDRYGIKEEFDLLISAADGMPGKPHPEIYLQTAEKLGIAPTFCLAIEDSFFGVLSAKAARMKVVAMPDPAERDQPRFAVADARIRSLREIDEKLFQELNR